MDTIQLHFTWRVYNSVSQFKWNWILIFSSHLINTWILKMPLIKYSTSYVLLLYSIPSIPKISPKEISTPTPVYSLCTYFLGERTWTFFLTKLCLLLRSRSNSKYNSWEVVPLTDPKPLPPLLPNISYLTLLLVIDLLIAYLHKFYFLWSTVSATVKGAIKYWINSYDVSRWLSLVKLH